MRFLHLLAVVLFASCLGSYWVEAQTTRVMQPARQDQTKEQAGAPWHTPAPTISVLPVRQGNDQPATQSKSVPHAPEQPPSKIDDVFKVSRESLQKALQEAKERGSLQPYRLLAGNGPRRDRGPGSFDNGIYLRQVDGANVCGAIVSYNFSSGENPQLESVTTCTPANAVRSMRAWGKTKMPRGPQVVRVVFQRDEKK